MSAFTKGERPIPTQMILESLMSGGLDREGEDPDAWQREYEEEPPTAIDPRRHMHYVEVSEDGLVATFVGRGEYTDVGAVQANHPLPRNCSISYFEVTVLEASSSKPSICVGVAPASALLNRPPGLEARSAGYRAEDGRRHCRRSRPATGVTEPVTWEVFGPPYGQGDVVGCGIINISRGIFFTRNGAFVGQAGKVSTVCDVFPTASMRHTGDSIRMNFSGPFLFNLRLLFHRQQLEERQLICDEKVSEASLLYLVRSYLLHAGFQKTLHCLDGVVGEQQGKGKPEDVSGQKPEVISQSPRPLKSSESDGDTNVSRTPETVSQDEGDAPYPDGAGEPETTLISWPRQVPRRLAQSLATRAEIIQAVMEGRIPSAIALVELHYPLVLASLEDETSALARALLYTQEVIECVRPPQRDVEAAVHCMQTKISNLTGQIPTYIQKALRECLGILAYEEPEHSPLASVFHLSRRSITASAVNKCILKKHLHVPEWSPLELLIRHLVASRQVLRILQGSRGPIPSSREYSHPIPLKHTTAELEAELRRSGPEYNPKPV